MENSATLGMGVNKNIKHNVLLVEPVVSLVTVDYSARHFALIQ